MDANQFKPGDLVRLKSGGPIMTVRRFNTRENWICDWFDSKGEHQMKEFRGDQLENVNDQNDAL